MSPRTRRDFLKHSATAAALPLVPGPWRKKRPSSFAKSDAIRIAVVGVNGRGRGHVSAFTKSKDSRVVAICDADEAVVDMSMRMAEGAKYVKDIRKLLEDDGIDAISIATPNHWHSLATIWGLQAGKHVYVEKPLSHDVHEGRMVVEIARRAGLVVQHGTQARTEKATRDAMEWLQAGGLGKVHVARGLCYKRRTSIGKVEAPTQPPTTCDYDLWTGPADLVPLQREKLHYDWHWVFNTGNGDMGNQGVHQMDIARWGLGIEELPRSVRSCGGRLGYDDDGDTPNTQVSVFDYGDRKIIFEVRGLETDPYMTAKIGTIFHGEKGYLVSASYSRLHAYDHDGKVMKTFQGGGDHFQQFLDAVKTGKPSAVNATALDGHLSSALCHLGNISYLLGRPQKLASVEDPFGDAELANESFHRFREHLVANGLNAAKSDYTMGPELAFDPATERFTGPRADEANALLGRPGRGPFRIPDHV